MADEVRKLAERSSGATKEITELIRAVRQSVAEAVSGMDASTVEVERMSGFSEELVRVMETVSAVVEENTAAMEEMAANSAEVNEAIDGIASVSEENSAAVQEVSAQVEEVTASAQSLNEMAQALQQLVAQFKLTGQESPKSEAQASYVVQPAQGTPSWHQPVSYERVLLANGNGKKA